MVADILTSSITSSGVPLVGGGLIGFAVGYALKKIAKFVVIGIGLIALLIAYLEYQKWISANWAVIESQTSTMMTQAYVVTHEIPTGIGLGVVGFLPGLAMGFAKG